MSQQHYFSELPDGSQKTFEVSFEVGGRNFTLQAASGTFSATRLDQGTRVLLAESEFFPDSGEVLDIGCGWGPIGITIASLRPATKVLALDVNQRSISLANSNAKRLGLSNFQALAAEQIAQDQTFDAIWSNPPIRIGKAALHQLMESWLPRLRPGGIAMLVVQKQLGAESFQAWLTDRFPNLEVTKHSIAKGYRVIRVARPANSQ